MRYRVKAAALIVIAVVGAACPDRKEDHQERVAPSAGGKAPRAAAEGTHADEQEAHEGLPSKVRLSPEVVQAAGVKTAAATMDTLPATVELTGEIATDPDRSARLAARVSARVVEVRVKEGERVKAGQVVAVLESPELARARATLTSALARARSARLNAQRVNNLEAKALAAGQEVAAAQAEAEALEAEVAAARQTLAAFGTDALQGEGAVARMSLRAPLGGFVLARDAVPGQTVDAEHVIATIGDLDHAYFLGRIFEKDLALLRAGARVEVRLNAYPAVVFDGSVESIGKQLDPTARTVIARILVQNRDDLLKVGLFGSARVVTSRLAAQRPRIVVPLDAVTKIATKDVVFVLQDDGDFEVHPVTPGRTAGSRVEILTGLREGERVVVAGVFTLKSAVLKGTFGEDE
jgi:cobalt-zinc-cadmium efflux system membrane fusion protein